MIPPRPPKPSPTPLRRSKLLLVEGSTPLHFFEALLRHLGISDPIEIRDFGGVTDVKPAVAAYAESAEFKALVSSVGVVRDAEDDRDSAFASVRHALDATGLDTTNPDVRTSIYILPDDHQPGMIETLCVEAVRKDPVFPCVEAFFDCAEQNGASVPDDIRRAKNVAQAFIATRKDAQTFPGIAAYRGYWPWDNDVFDDLKQFLQSL
ncbi:MAG: DUF3226 domain-containing protein [Planctomycetaceae bacterium]